VWWRLALGWRGAAVKGEMRWQSLTRYRDAAKNRGTVEVYQYGSSAVRCGYSASAGDGDGVHKI
jgi:hypothetical protein